MNFVSTVDTTAQDGRIEKDWNLKKWRTLSSLGAKWPNIFSLDSFSLQNLLIFDIFLFVRNVHAFESNRKFRFTSYDTKHENHRDVVDCYCFLLLLVSSSRAVKRIQSFFLLFSF